MLLFESDFILIKVIDKPKTAHGEASSRLKTFCFQTNNNDVKLYMDLDPTKIPDYTENKTKINAKISFHKTVWDNPFEIIQDADVNFYGHYIKSEIVNDNRFLYYFTFGILNCDKEIPDAQSNRQNFQDESKIEIKWDIDRF
jgi:hypothetical protein